MTPSQDELREISDLFWQFHKDRLKDPKLTDMTPYITPILKMQERHTNEARIDELTKVHAEWSTNQTHGDKSKSFTKILGDRLSTLREGLEDLDPSIQKMVNENFQSLIWKQTPIEATRRGLE